MKMVTIYVSKEEWKGVTEKVLQLSAEGGVRISNGEYLMRLHRGTIKPRSSKNIVYEGNSDLVQEMAGKVVSDDIGTIGADLKKVIADHKEPDPIQKAASDLEKLKKSKKFRPEADASSGGQDFFNPMPKVGKKSKGGA